ncbi:class I SAM-dependent methyltransferase [Massilia endophytica]|uniref:class I SAM-dependent methyltransferase n=1 Tax=Massilia endophytica TaxID=2899220 RepID=UPI001E5372CA|nr:class I SAM-dependent methyltransferase [Massilia endophytica]UGQ45473.1 methyltransferase regulatory domain-containing protein [Massilia endophytica]
MSDWSAGYVADIGYTFGYYSELNPMRIQLAFLNAGLVFPEVGTACELGYGQGISINMHAAASVTEWHGTDFNPAQAGFAQELAGVARSNVKLYDESFAEFCTRDDLPQFDSIGLHGIWSWISDENRHIIVDFVRRKLKVGGVLYISYNTQPGWASMVPMRALLTEHSEVMGAQGVGIVPRIDAALEFAEKLMATNPMYARANPLINDRLKAMKGQNRSYLAHEYFNRDWHPMPFAKMAEWLAPAKLDFACSTHYFDHIESINMSPEQMALLKEVPDRMFRETVRDFMVNQQFRRDYWVRGLRKLPDFARAEQLREQRVIMTTPRQDVPLTIKAGIADANLQESVYGPILDALADNKIKTFGQVEKAVAERGIKFPQVVQALFVMIGAHHVFLAQPDAVIAKARPVTDRLNAYLWDMARSTGDINVVASPVTGGGFTLGRFGQLFLLARKLGHKTPGDWAKYASSVLTAQGQRMLRDGKTVDDVEEEVRELTVQATAFNDKIIPILKSMGITS